LTLTVSKPKCIGFHTNIDINASVIKFITRPRNC